MRYVEVEINNNFDFIFYQEGTWYKAYCYASNCDFGYNPIGREDKPIECYTRFLKPNYSYNLMCHVKELDGYDHEFPGMGYTEEETSSVVQKIEFNTNERCDIDIETIEFYDY